MWGRYGDAVCIREMARPGRAGPDGAMTLGLGAQRARIGDPTVEIAPTRVHGAARAA